MTSRHKSVMGGGSNESDMLYPMNHTNNNNHRELLPHGGNIPSSRLRKTTERPHLWLVIVVTAIPSFIFGSLVSLYVGVDGSYSNHVSDVVIEARVQQRIQTIRQEMETKRKATIDEQFHLLEAKMESGQLHMACDSQNILPHEHFGKFLVDLAQVPKDEFVQLLDPGVPLDASKEGADRVLLLYSNDKALPDKMKKNRGGANDVMTATEALQNCGQVNLILADNVGRRKQCFAVVPQYESYHIQKWERLDPTSGELSLKHPLQLVSRGHADKGKEEFKPPRPLDLKVHWDILKQFFDSADVVMAELKPILQKIARNNTVIVMVANFGQSELLMNFVCAAKARKLDMSHIIVFTTDTETTDIANGHGLATYFDKRVSRQKRFWSSLSWLILNLHTPSCLAEFWQNTNRSCREIRRSRILRHDDGQGHLCATSVDAWF